MTPPGGAPPSGVTPPAGGSPPPPPSGAPAGGTSPSDAVSQGLSKAKEIVDKAKQAHDKAEEIRDQVDALTPDDDQADEDEAPEDPPLRVADETVAPTEPIYVNYSNSWDEDPPSPSSSTVVVTQVVHPPPPPPPSIPEEPPQTERPRSHGFMGMSVRGTTSNYAPSALLGGRLGYTFRERFTVAGAFHSLTARYGGAIRDVNGKQLGLRMSYGGVLLGWRLYSGRVVHLGVETLAGAGAACISRDPKSVGRARCLEKVGLVSVEPGVQLAFVVSDWTRLGLTAGYRFVTREAWRAPNDFTLSGAYVGLSLDFGPFRVRRRCGVSMPSES